MKEVMAGSGQSRLCRFYRVTDGVAAPTAVSRGPPVRCSAMGTVVLDGQIYVCGGYDGNSSLNSVESYSPETNK